MMGANDTTAADRLAQLAELVQRTLSDAELALVVQAWPDLPESTRQWITTVALAVEQHADHHDAGDRP